MSLSHPTDLHIGLTRDEAAHAPKNLLSAREPAWMLGLRVAKNQVVSFFFILLVVSGGLSLFLGQVADALIFFGIALINSIIGFFQEYHANKSTQALEKIVQHHVTVRREGEHVTLPHTEVVLGDIMLLSPGSVVVVDCTVREAKNAFLDESVVTGETLPRVVAEGEDISSGVTVVSGTIAAQVTAVGAKSSLMKYAEKIAKISKDSNFDRFIFTISRAVIVMTVVCLVLVFIMNVLVMHGMVFSEYMLYAVSMLVGVVPESLPLIVTVILTREALLLSKHKVLIKKLSVLENLGSMRYLFTDKTGTITENNLRVKELVDLGSGLPDSLRTIATGMYERTPMDSVFDTAIEKHFKEKGGEKSELGFSPFRVEAGYAEYAFPNGDTVIRGQYHLVAAASVGDHTDFEHECAEFEKNGSRIIALARKASGASEYTLEGAVVFEDPLKDDAVHMYRELSALGVEVKVITGDSIDVARSVGTILRPEAGERFAYAMDSKTPESKERIAEYFIYARCKPEEKSVLIDEHLNRGVVGFLGEGINDAMALKRADIGFVVNNASDIARQSGDVILLEKSLSPVVAAVKLSREAFVKVRTYLLCTLTGNVGTLLSLTAVTITWGQLPMLPIQVLLNNILTDLPLIFLITDNISALSVEKPIRDETKKFFRKIFVFGLLITLFDFVFFFFFRGYDISVLRTGWFVFSVFAELTLVFSLRSDLSLFKAPALGRVLMGVLALCYGIALALPFVGFGSLFHFVPLSLIQVGLIAGICAVFLVASECAKRLMRLS